MPRVGREYELVVVAVKVVFRDLFALEGVHGVMERSELLTHLSVIETLERLQTLLYFTDMLLNELCEGEGCFQSRQGGALQLAAEG